MNLEVVGKRHIYILLTNTGSLLNKTIKLYTKAPYNHTSIALDKNLNEVYSFGRKTPNNPFIGGLVREDLNGIYSHFKDTTCAVYALEIDYKVYKRVLKNIDKFQLKRDSYKYNFVGLFGVAINRPIYRENAFFCSQFIATILNKSGLNLFNKMPELITPYDFQSSDKLKLIYEGRILDYAPQLAQPVIRTYGFSGIPVKIMNTISKYV